MLLTDIYLYWFYDHKNSVKQFIRRQIILLLNPDIIKDKGRLKSALNKKKKLIYIVLRLGVDAIIDYIKAITALLRLKTGLRSHRDRILSRGRSKNKSRDRSKRRDMILIRLSH